MYKPEKNEIKVLVLHTLMRPQRIRYKYPGIDIAFYTVWSYKKEQVEIIMQALQMQSKNPCKDLVVLSPNTDMATKFNNAMVSTLCTRIVQILNIMFKKFAKQGAGTYPLLFVMLNYKHDV